MPSKSKAQHSFMEGVAHDAKFASKVGVPVSVGKDFVSADKERNIKKLPAYAGPKGTKATHGYGR